MNEVNERLLIEQCQQGEKTGFNELIKLYYPYISKFLLKVTHDQFLAENLTQDTFLKMIGNIERYDLDGKASFGTWLVTIAKNSYIDYIRRNRMKFTNIDETRLESEINVLEQVDRKLQYEKLLQSIDKLPPEQGMAIRLKYEEDLTLEEIGKIFGVPSKTIKSRIHDGVTKLRRMLS